MSSHIMSLCREVELSVPVADPDVGAPRVPDLSLLLVPDISQAEPVVEHCGAAALNGSQCA